MTLEDINNQISFETSQSTISFTNADRLRILNSYYRDVQSAILRNNDNWDFDDKNNGDYPILITNLVANQQDYILPTNALQLKRVEMSYDGTNWVKLNEFDIGQRNYSTATNNLGDFSQANPFYDVQYNSLFLYPIPGANVTGGLKIWTTRQISEFTLSDLTAGTLEPGFDSPFHKILYLGTAFNFASSKGMANKNDLKVRLDEAYAELKQAYGKKELEGNYQMVSGYNNFR